MSDMSDRVIVTNDAVRPAETAAHRLDWLLGTASLYGMVEAVDYRGQSARDVLRDIVDALDHRHEWIRCVGTGSRRLPNEEQYLTCSCGLRRDWGEPR